MSKAFQQMAKLPSRTVTPTDLQNSTARGQVSGFLTSQVEKMRSLFYFLLLVTTDGAFSFHLWSAHLTSCWYTSRAVDTIAYITFCFAFTISFSVYKCLYVFRSSDFVVFAFIFPDSGVKLWNFPPFHNDEAVLFLSRKSVITLRHFDTREGRSIFQMASQLSQHRLLKKKIFPTDSNVTLSYVKFKIFNGFSLLFHWSFL